jgi:hypothetical protein
MERKEWPVSHVERRAGAHPPCVSSHPGADGAPLAGVRVDLQALDRAVPVPSTCPVPRLCRGSHPFLGLQALWLGGLWLTITPSTRVHGGHCTCVPRPPTSESLLPPSHCSLGACGDGERQRRARGRGHLSQHRGACCLKGSSLPRVAEWGEVRSGG